MLTFITILLVTQLPPGKLPEKKKVENCMIGENTEKIIILKRLDISYTVSDQKLFSSISSSFIPVKEWKNNCRYLIKKRIKIFKVPENTIVKGEISNGINNIKIPARVIKSKDFYYIESGITIPPFDSQPSDNILTFKFEFETETFPSSDEGGVKRLTIFLRQFLKYKTTEDFSGKIFAEFYDRWISHGSTLPEDNTVGKRHGWKLDRKFSQDLMILFADFEVTGDPQKNDEKPRPEQIDPVMFIITSIATLIIIGGVLLVYRRRKNKSPQNPDADNSPDKN
ncbi:hypothetical protein KKF34_09120 [Myxococcota bacterium]|nr:hypothetical protein [Myxococcota bacterium]MBU1380895.1 hypothetical protein [Myxococcota bacterium]MBU1497023.1 hypothetical protein [Myxococcota bacterium]